MPCKNEISERQRDEMLFLNYLRVIKSFGNDARYIPALVKYERAAEPFNISPDRASRIIKKKLREKGRSSNVNIEECNELLDTLTDLHRPSLERMVNGLNKILIRVGIDKTSEEVKQLVQEYLIK